jgi:alpha-tubulin suppressor-like RCC1 family protein
MLALGFTVALGACTTLVGDIPGSDPAMPATSEEGGRPGSDAVDSALGDAPSDKEVIGEEIRALTLGGGHTCALTSTGGVQCWGDNSGGQLGDGTTTRRLTPVPVSGLASGVTAIAAGEIHTCALTTEGAVKCWGDNNHGQLGDSTGTAHVTPFTVSGLSSGVTAIAAGYSYTCAITTGGAVECWGDNSGGQLGDGTKTDRLTPVTVSGLSSGVTAIDASFSHTCALTTGGAAKCWGSNADGQLGDGTTTERLTPVTVSDLSSGVTAIEAGCSHTCALTTGGAAKCWGSNADGHLGDGSGTYQLTPVSVPGLTSGVTAIASGGWGHTCALTTGGAVKCWGFNEGGALGDGTLTTRVIPVAVSGLSSGVTAIAAGGNDLGHTCAVVTGGALKCWGYNDFGQVGDGTTTWRFTPVNVVGF